MKKSLGSRTLLYPTPVTVIGTYDIDGKPNAATVAWAGIVCSQPPCVGISLRKATYTYGAIMGRRAFTLSIPSEEFVSKVDYLGMASGRDENKLANAGLTPVDSTLVDAPYIKEFPMVLECKVINVVEIGLHTQFIGEIVDVKVEESLLDESGQSNIKRVRPFVYAPDERFYYSIGERLEKSFDTGRKYSKKAQG
jgi:flavin reductase (DIM6/NTAB) family NADH-FMN oxidoreductase RutF